MANIVPYNQELYQVGHLMGDSLITNSTQKPVMRFYYGYPQFNNPLAYIDRYDISPDGFLNNSNEYIKWSDYNQLIYLDDPSLSMSENLPFTSFYMPNSTGDYNSFNTYLYSKQSITDIAYPGIEINFKQRGTTGTNLGAMICIWSMDGISQLFNTRLLGVLFVNNYFDAQIFIPRTLSSFRPDKDGNRSIYWSFHAIDGFNYSNFIRNYRIKLLPSEISAARSLCLPEPDYRRFTNFFMRTITSVSPSMYFGPTFSDYAYSTYGFGPSVANRMGFEFLVEGENNFSYYQLVNSDTGWTRGYSYWNYWPSESNVSDFFRDIRCILFGPLILPYSQFATSTVSNIYKNNPYKITIRYDRIIEWAN